MKPSGCHWVVLQPRKMWLVCSARCGKSARRAQTRIQDGRTRVRVEKATLYGSNDEGDAGFEQKSMYDQLGKILDSQGNPSPVETVTTDDGKEIPVSAGQAKTLRMFATADNVKPNVRLSFLKDIQHSRGLADFLDVRDYKEMADLFIKKYL